MTSESSIPETFPAFQIEPATDSADTVTCSCFPPTCDPLQPGISLRVIRFDMAKGKPVSFRRGRSRGPVLKGGRTMTEVRWIEETPAGGRRFRIHWLYRDETAGDIVLAMRELRVPQGSGILEETDIRHPGRLFSHRKHTFKDVYRQGRWVRKTAFQVRVDGPFRLTLGKERYPVLRSVTAMEGEDDRKVEHYIDTATGRLMLARVIVRMPDAPEAEFVPRGYRWVTAYLPVWETNTDGERVQTV